MIGATLPRPAANPPTAAADLKIAGTDKPPKNPDDPPKKDTGEQAVSVRVVEMPPSPLTQIQDWLGPLVAPLTTAGIVVVLVLFMLVDRENQRNRLVQLFGRSHMHTTTEAIHDVAGRVGRYLRMLFLVNASYGLAIAVGLWLIGVPGRIMWGVLGFSLRFLPYSGPWIAAMLPIMVSIATTDGWTQPMLVARLVSSSSSWFRTTSSNRSCTATTIGISTVGVIISAIFWTWLWGPIGLILSMPMTVCLVVSGPLRAAVDVSFRFCLPINRRCRRPNAYTNVCSLSTTTSRSSLRTSYLKESSLIDYYDDVLVPALVMAEHDRHADLLNDDQSAFVLKRPRTWSRSWARRQHRPARKEQTDEKAPAASE